MLSHPPSVAIVFACLLSSLQPVVATSQAASTLAAAPTDAPAAAAAAAAVPATPREPRTFLRAPSELIAVRERAARGEVALRPALAALRREAEALLGQKPRSVMDKTLTGASGDKHDYYTWGPYWWPDSKKPGGLPYIRRDGEVNPESRSGNDYEAFLHTCKAVDTLGLAYCFLETSASPGTRRSWRAYGSSTPPRA